MRDLSDGSTPLEDTGPYRRISRPGAFSHNNYEWVILPDSDGIFRRQTNLVTFAPRLQVRTTTVSRFGPQRDIQTISIQYQEGTGLETGSFYKSTRQFGYVDINWEDEIFGQIPPSEDVVVAHYMHNRQLREVNVFPLRLAALRKIQRSARDELDELEDALCIIDDLANGTLAIEQLILDSFETNTCQLRTNRDGKAIAIEYNKPFVIFDREFIIRRIGDTVTIEQTILSARGILGIRFCAAFPLEEPLSPQELAGQLETKTWPHAFARPDSTANLELAA